MSRILARSISADLFARSYNLLLFVLLLPFILLFARHAKPLKVRPVPFSAPQAARR